MTYKITPIIKYILADDIDAFDKAIQEHNIDINLNFDEELAKEDADFHSFVIPPAHYNGEVIFEHDFYTFLNVAIGWSKFNYDFCNYLIAKGAKPTNPETGSLYLAIRKDDVSLFNLIRNLYDEAPDPYLVYSIATQNESFKICDFLLENEHLPIKGRYVPIFLHDAVKANNIKILEYLSTNERCIKWLSQTWFLTELLNEAADYNYTSFNAFRWLVEKYCTTKERCYIALDVMLKTNVFYHHILWLLNLCAERGLDFNATHKDNDPIIFRITKQNMNAQEAIDLEILDSEIMKEYQKDNIECLKFLLNHDIDVYNTRDSLGRNFIEFLFAHGSETTVQFREFFSECLGICARHFKGIDIGDKELKQIPLDKDLQNQELIELKNIIEE